MIQHFIICINKHLQTTNMTSLQNPAPKLYNKYELSFQDLQARKADQYNTDIQDPIDELQVFELIRYLNDPQYPLSLQQLNVVNLERCYIKDKNKVQVHFTPTIPHCSMAQLIGLMIKVKLGKFLPPSFKIKVRVTEGTHVNEVQINKQINDKERIAAALENPSISRVLKRGFYNSDRFQLK